MILSTIYAASFPLLPTTTASDQKARNSHSIFDSSTIGDTSLRDEVPISGFRTCLAELSEREVLAEFCLLINTYFCHNLKSKNHKCYGDTVIWRQHMMTLPVFLENDLSGAILHEVSSILNEVIVNTDKTPYHRITVS